MSAADEVKTPVVLTHNMRAHKSADGANAYWYCVDCGRAGTVKFINLVPCIFAIPSRAQRGH